MQRNSWPSGMIITVEDHPQHLHMLLFVREAWSLAADMDIPVLRPAPDVGVSQMPATADPEEWASRWKKAWARAWDWYEISAPSHEQPLYQDEMREISKPGQNLHPVIPPFWAVEYGMEGLDQEAFERWDRRLLPKFPPKAERRSMPELVEAWQGGLTTVIVVPYAGYFAHRLSDRHLVVSAETRNDPEMYSRALKTRL